MQCWLFLIRETLWTGTIIRVLVLLYGSRAVSELLTVVILVEGEGGAAGSDPDDND